MAIWFHADTYAVCALFHLALLLPCFTAFELLLGVTFRKPVRTALLRLYNLMDLC